MFSRPQPNSKPVSALCSGPSLSFRCPFDLPPPHRPATTWSLCHSKCQFATIHVHFSKIHRDVTWRAAGRQSLCQQLPPANCIRQKDDGDNRMSLSSIFSEESSSSGSSSDGRSSSSNSSGGSRRHKKASYDRRRRRSRERRSYSRSQEREKKPDRPSDSAQPQERAASGDSGLVS
jgi:hypothetical protein